MRIVCYGVMQFKIGIVNIQRHIQLGKNKEKSCINARRKAKSTLGGEERGGG